MSLERDLKKRSDSKCELCGSVDDLKVYQLHPEHLKVVDFVKTVSTERAAVDFEI